MPLDCDGWFSDYREKIVVSQEAVQCDASSVMIPAGTPHALCEGFYDGEWGHFRQCLGIWRLLRNVKRNEGHCLSFLGEDEELSNVYRGDDGFLLAVRFAAVRKSEKKRMLEGRPYRLSPYEAASLQSGEWAEWVAWHDGKGWIHSHKDGTKTWDERDSEFGKKWVPDMDTPRELAA